MLAFWMGGAWCPPRRPSRAVIIFPKFQLKGTGTFFFPIPPEEVCIPIVNQYVLSSLAGWGVLDLSTQFSFDPCAVVEEEPIIVSAGAPILTPTQIADELWRVERARQNAIRRQETRTADPHYVEPEVFPATPKTPALPVVHQPFTVATTKYIPPRPTGIIRLLVTPSIAALPTPSPAAAPQPVVKPEEPKAKPELPVAHAAFDIGPINQPQRPAERPITIIQEAKPAEPTTPAAAPPQPVAKPEQPAPAKSPGDIKHHKPMDIRRKKRR